MKYNKYKINKKSNKFIIYLFSFLSLYQLFFGYLLFLIIGFVDRLSGS